MAKNVEKSRQPSRRDVELVQANAEITKARARIEKWRYVGNALTWGVGIASCALPIWALGEALRPFAGESSSIDINVLVSVSIVVSLTLGGAALVKIIKQRSTIRRLRKRIEDLEQGRL